MLDDSVVRKLVESAPDAIVVVDADGNMVLVNDETERLFGYSQRELLGRPIEVLVPSRLRSPHAGHRDAYLHSPHSRPMGAGLTLTARRKDGAEVPVEISLSPVESANGPVVAAIVRDITERRRAEDIIRGQAELLEYAHDAIIVLDMRGRIEYWNTGAEQTYGWTAAEAIGKDIHKLLQTSPVAATIEEVHAALASDGRWEGELEQTTLDGRGIVVASRRTLRRGPDGAAASMLEIDRDITERKQIERERAVMQMETDRQHDRDRIAMDLHDGVIQSIYAVGLNLESAAFALDDDPDDSRAQIEGSIEQLHGVISDIRSYIFQLQRPDLTDDLTAAIEHLAANAEKSAGLPVRLAFDGSPAAMTPEQRFVLYHVAQEALSNILRHARASSAAVSLCSGDDAVTLSIEDDGAGFDASVDAGEAHRGVRNMRARAASVAGDVTVESAPGEGTRIRCRIPI
jgi:PAS domain S-box-containing protein